jgi:hypothetical protein
MATTLFHNAHDFQVGEQHFNISSAGGPLKGKYLL